MSIFHAKNDNFFNDINDIQIEFLFEFFVFEYFKNHIYFFLFVIIIPIDGQETRDNSKRQINQWITSAIILETLFWFRCRFETNRKKLINCKLLTTKVIANNSRKSKNIITFEWNSCRTIKNNRMNSFSALDRKSQAMQRAFEREQTRTFPIKLTTHYVRSRKCAEKIRLLNNYGKNTIDE